jgi:hypothetical protein
MNESEFELSVRQAAPELAGHPALEGVLGGAKTGKRPLYPEKPPYSCATVYERPRRSELHRRA